MNNKIKKLLILNIPYLLLALLFTKVPQAWRLAAGHDIGVKILNLTKGFALAFENPLPSLYPKDLLFGITVGVILRLIVYLKGKNAKKYRKGTEYGSARWGGKADIQPYIDPDFQNNILLTQTERLTMSSRPPKPQYARNKNVVVIGVSKDSVASHMKFAQKYELPFILLSDPELQAIHAYDVWQEKKLYGKVSMGVVRSTYIIDEQGMIEKVMPKVKPDTNAAEILEYLAGR